VNSARKKGASRGGATLGHRAALHRRVPLRESAPAARAAGHHRRGFGKCTPYPAAARHGRWQRRCSPARIAVESVGKEHDRPRLWAGNARRLAPSIAAPARQAAPRAQPRVSLRPLPAGAGRCLRMLASLGTGGKRRIAGEIADEALVQREPTLCHARRLHLDLHAQPCRHRSGTRAGTPCRRRKAAKSPPSRPRCSASSPSWPVMARRSVLARPRVTVALVAG